MSSVLQQQQRRLGAWMARDEDFVDHPENPAGFESKARTFLCFLENVFGRFYEFKTRLCDYDDIPESYAEDWERFRADACSAARESRPFNGICAVMHLQAAPEGRAYVIQNVGLRPCAIEQSFLRVMLKHLAQSLSSEKQLVVKMFGVRVEFLNTVIANLRESDPAFSEPSRAKQDRVTLMGKKAESGRFVDVITFDSLAALRTIKAPWHSASDAAFPTAEQLNDSSQANPRRVELIRRMIGLAHDGFAQYLASASDLTNYLPDALNLDEKDLWVYKGGTKLSFRPEERRFFMRDRSKLYFEVCWGAKDDKPIESIDSLQGGKSIRFEFAGGKFVFFLLPKDFARKGVQHTQGIKLDGRASSVDSRANVVRLMTAIIMDGEKIVGMDGDRLLLSEKRGEETAVTVWHEKKVMDIERLPKVEDKGK